MQTMVLIMIIVLYLGCSMYKYAMNKMKEQQTYVRSTGAANYDQ